MRSNALAQNIPILLVIFAVGFGCKYLQTTKEPEFPKITNTPVTKEILRERLAQKGIESVPVRDVNDGVKPNPLTLYLELVRYGADPPRYRLNNSKDYEFEELVKNLKSIFAEREKN